MASPTLVDYKVTTTTFATSRTANITGLTKAVGDVLLIVANCDAGHVLANSDSSYTLLYGVSNNNYCTQYVWYKVCTASEANPTISTDAGSEPWRVIAMSIRSWDSSTILYATATGQSATMVAPDVIANTDALVIRLEDHQNGSITITTPATEIEKGNSGATSSNQNYSAESQENKTGSGSVGTATFTASATARYITATLVFHGAGGAVASLIQVYEDPWYSGQEDVINGQNFEASQGSGTVTLSQVALTASFTVQSWSDTELEVTAPLMLSSSLRSGDTVLTVTPDSNAASTKTIQYEYSPDHRYVNIDALASDLTTRIEATSLATDWQLVYSTYLYDSTGLIQLTDYQVIVRDDGTFTVSGLPPDGTYKLPVVEYNSSTNVWGAFVNQTIVVNIGIDVLDTVAPVVIAPDNITINIALADAGLPHASSHLVTWLGTATASDAVDGDLTDEVTNNLSTTLANPIPVGGPYTITFSATDEAGNIGTDTATLTVTQSTDVEGPVVSVPDSLTIRFAYGGVGVSHSNSTLLSWLALATADDTVDGNVTASLTNNLSTLPSPIPEGTYPIIWTAEDEAGNEGTNTQFLIVIQEDPPPATSSGFMSGSVDFVVSCSEIIADAYRHLGCLGEGETLTPYRIAFAQRQKNLLLKHWATKGYRLWTLYEGQLTLVAAQNSYTIGLGGNLNLARPLRILQARVLDDDGFELTLTPISRKEYFDLPNKTSSGKPSQFYYDPQFTGSARTAKGKLYVWPTPETGTTDKINFTYSQYIQDYDSSLDDTPIPVEWGLPLTFGLAVLLAGSENVGGEDLVLVKSLADQFFKDAAENDNDTTTNIQFGCGYQDF